MNFYIRPFKNDFVNCNITITTNPAGFFQMNWFKGVPANTMVDGLLTTTYSYPDTPNVTDIITTTKMLLEKKTNLPLDNPHQLIACGVSEETNRFSFVDVLKYTYQIKGSTGFFNNATQIRPIMYILVPFADSPIDDWTFVAVANNLTVDGTAVTTTFDVDINQSLADTCNQNLPGITLTKTETTVSAQLVDASGNPISKAGIDIYFETTAGYLTKARGVTNSSGVATTQVIGAEEGKVKAGFKYFSGKTQITI